LTAQQDQLIQQELLRRNDLPSNVLLLLRHTGMRIGECVDLAYDCLHSVGPDRWTIHVPLGKLKIALGLDRLVALLAEETSIREVIPFLKTAKGTDLMCDAPSEVQEKNLRELGISLRKK
jgi:hypothetical protein